MPIFMRSPDSPDWRLTDEDKASYLENGYVILRNLFPSKVERDDLISWVMGIKGWENRPNEHMHYEEIDKDGNRFLTLTENFVDFHPQLGELLRSKALAKLVEDVTGEPMVLFKEKIVYKSAGGGGFPAHTDAPSYQHIRALNHLSLAMAVEPATVENGCVEVVPGSHLLKDFPIREDKCIADSWCSKQTWVPITLDTGDIFIFSSFLAHRSANNASNTGRAMIYATFNPTREGGDQRKAYYAHRRMVWPATFEREVGKKYTEGYDMYAWGTPMSTVEFAT
ncbi:PhyH-domain-containing protein [Calocera viscosa TUFC12733]|uniref:PhyH-domain-containing protein n=1 Tax=Calocera viscosa (strain TUFC12733) TaxID=1330018 RepID=A0A167HIW2_CALVF|nr:PhyH-domain-containing protein [Calocera viscosa TUFC12733]